MDISQATIFLSFLSAIVGGSAVALINHWLSFKRDVATKQRDISLSKLVEAWLLLDQASDKGPKKGEIEKFFEALKLIILFGSDHRTRLSFRRPWISIG